MIRIQDDGRKLELRFIPAISMVALVFFSFFFIVLLIFPFAQDFDEEFTLAMWGGVLVVLLISILVVFAIMRRRWGKLEISDKIYYTLKLKKQYLALPLDSAREIWITGRTSQVDNTLYRLLVETGEGKGRYLYLGEHRFTGKRATRLVRLISERLNIPVRDPFAEKYQGSWFMINRWLAGGEDWKFYLLIIVVFLAVALAINLLSS
ncbi:MAG: hypothetical protein ACOCWZ_00955 [Spirochaetota bacterium]